MNTMLSARKIFARLIFGAVTGYARRRKGFADKWLSGHGLEVGALHNPLPVPADADVTYVDIVDNKELRRIYPELSNKRLVSVDLVDDGESLLSIERESQDFVIVNHVLEHCVNPIGALQAWLRVLKYDGIAYVAVPDKHFTFDYRRPITTWNHFLEDFNGDAENSKKAHYRDWLKNVTMVSEAEFETAFLDILKEQPNIHFHTWTKNTLKAFLERSQIDLSFPFAVREFVRNGSEVIAILQKSGKPQPLS